MGVGIIPQTLRDTDTGQNGEEMSMKLPQDYLELLKSEYPRRNGEQGWIAVRTLIPRAISAGATWEEILAGTRAYKSYCDRMGKTGSEWIRQAKNFYGPDQYWTEDYGEPEKPKTAAQISEARRWDGLRDRALASNFRQPMSIESPDVYETQLRHHEREAPVTDLSKNDTRGAVLSLVSAKRMSK